jgi:hypothetical protein
MSVLGNNFFNLKKNHQKQHESIMGSFSKKSPKNGLHNFLRVLGSPFLGFGHF